MSISAGVTTSSERLYNLLAQGFRVPFLNGLSQAPFSSCLVEWMR